MNVARGIKVSTRYSQYNDVTFVNLNAGKVSVQGSEDGKKIPQTWRVTINGRVWTGIETGQLRTMLPARGRVMCKMIRAMERGVY